MAPGEVTTECPHCGQKLRGEWLRCPRCRELVAADAQPAPDEASQPASWRKWLAGGVAAVVSVAAIGLVSSSVAGTNADTRASQSARERQAFPTLEPISVDEEVLAQHKSEDEGRMGYAAYSSGDLDSALARFEAAVDAKPDDAEARNNLGQVLVRQNRAADALTHFDEAIRLDGAKWAYRFNRARAYMQLKRFPQAVADYRVAAELFPDDYVTHYNLSLVYIQMEQYADAVASLERAVSLAPAESSFLPTLGSAYIAVNEHEKAKATFEKFLSMAAADDTDVPRVKALLEMLSTGKAGA